MENIKYYEDLTNYNLLAYERITEFFVKYDFETKKWNDCNISFLVFKHDYEFKEISREEALQKTAGNLPETKLKEYHAILSENGGGSINE